MYLGYPYIESVHGAVKCSWGIHTRKACTELQGKCAGAQKSKI